MPSHLADAGNRTRAALVRGQSFKFSSSGTGKNIDDIAKRKLFVHGHPVLGLACKTQFCTSYMYTISVFAYKSLIFNLRRLNFIYCAIRTHVPKSFKNEDRSQTQVFKLLYWLFILTFTWIIAWKPSKEFNLIFKFNDLCVKKCK